MMSASDVLHHPSTGGNRRGRSASGSGSGSNVIRPAQVTEKSFIESVAGFINEVQSAPVGNAENKVHVTWARFEIADVNDPKFYPDGAEINGNSPPLLLTLGYTSGVQVWLIPINGEAQEVLSWKQGTVKTLRVLPTPEACFGSPDNFAHCRPLIALADSTGPGTAYSSASFLSLKSGEQVHNIKFNSEIVDIVVNRRVVVTTFKEKLAVFDACSLEARFTITSCYPSPGVVANPISLGDRWLAYADQKLVAIHRSFGGLETDSAQSMAAWGINVGSKLAQGVSKIYSNFFSGTSPASSSLGNRPSGQTAHSALTRGDSGSEEPQKGVVTILDIMKVYKTEREEVNIVDKIDGVIAHFIAHNKAIVALQFDHSGSLLLTCDRLGNHFNLFRIVPHPAGACYAAVHHLYSLFRGDTPGSVQDVAFSPDSRWVTVSTLRGTTHIFPITPYGGPVGVRTHTSNRVVNRLSRFHRSAGIDETKTSSCSSGRNSPNPNLAGTSPGASSLGKLAVFENAMGSMYGTNGGPPIVLAYPNPHMPPFPSPTIVQAVAQLRQPYIVTLTNQTIGTATSVSRKKSGSGSSTSPEDVPIRLAATFAPSRAWLVGSQHNMFNRQRQRPHDALYIVANHGVLLEYSIDALADSTLPKEKVCESSPIELHVTAYGQWTLTPPRDRSELQPPLPIDSPLMLPSPAVFDKYFGLPNSAKAKPQVEDSDEEKWLSQVEIITHFGPHRRLWMGPQFSFKTLVPAENGRGNKEVELDISLSNRPEQSNPVNMPSPLKHLGQDRQGKMPVLIEACSASSFELSPRFSNAYSKHNFSGKKDAPQDVAKELEEAMSETHLEESLLDGSTSRATGLKNKKVHQESSEEEFFCLTPEDARSLSSRSRNASATSQTSQKVTISGNHSIPMSMPDTKIFSVAVEARKSDQIRTDGMKVCDLDADFSGRFAVVSSDQKQQAKQQNKEAAILEPTKVTEVSEGEESGKSKKSKKKNKKKEAKAVNNSQDSTESETSLKLKNAKSRDITPMKNEDISDIQPLSDEFSTGWVTEATDDLVDKDKVKLEACPQVEEDGSTHSDEFMEVTNKIDSKSDSEDEEFKFKVASPSFDLNSSAKPRVSGWMDDLLKSESSDAILKGIEKAEKLWDDGTSLNKSASTGFELDSLLFGKGKSGVTSSFVGEKEEDESTSQGLLFKEFEKVDNQPPNAWKTPPKISKDVLDETEEKTPLEDVFKFDSELNEYPPLAGGSKKAIERAQSLDDLNDEGESAEDENGNEEGSNKMGKNMAASLNVDVDEGNLISSSAARESIAGLSGSFGSTSVSSESSVGNSPNPKKNAQKKKKKKRK